MSQCYKGTRHSSQVSSFLLMSDPHQTIAALVENGNRLAEAGNLAEAKTAFEEACQRDNQSALAYFGLGTTYYRLDDDENAVKALITAARLSPETPEIWNNLGACYGRIGKVKMAIKAFQTVCTLQPNHAPAAMNLGRLLLGRDRRKR